MVRRLVPFLIEATFIPSVLFYVLFVLGGMPWALAGAFTWMWLRRAACVEGS